MPIYLGPAGALQTLPSPRTGVDASLVRQGGVVDLAGGGRRVDTTGYVRSYKLTWASMSSTTLSTLEGLYIGLYGPGVFLMVDTMRTNMLPANVATGTDTEQDTSLFTATVGALSSSTTLAVNGLRSLKWTPGSLASAQSVTAPTPVTSYAAPALSGQSYTASMQARLDSGSAAANGRAELRWYDSAGAALSTNQGTSTALSTSAWTFLSVTATPPVGAVYVGVAFQTPTTGVSPVFLVDALQLELASSASPWVVGTGVPRVAVDQMTDTYPQRLRHDVTLTVLEV